MAAFADSYRGRRVFVTGHTGFKGAWLAEWLTTLGAEVTGYALDPPTQPNLFDALDLGARLTTSSPTSAIVTAWWPKSRPRSHP